MGQLQGLIFATDRLGMKWSTCGRYYLVGYWVRRQRKALDLTQTALAEQVGCALVTVKKIERDERRPSRGMAELLADHLAVEAATGTSSSTWREGCGWTLLPYPSHRLNIPLRSLRFRTIYSNNQPPSLVEKRN